MSRLTTDLVVMRQDWSRHSKRFPKGCGYCEDQGTRLLLVKRWKWRGKVFFTWVTDREEVPLNVIIAYDTLGYSSSAWKSKFAEHMKGR